MFCHYCGAGLQEGAGFCASCGKPVGGAPLMPTKGRIAGHVRLLGILWLAMSGMHLIPGLFLLGFAEQGLPFLPQGVPLFVHGILEAIGWTFIGVSAIGLVAGWGLLDRQPWARMLAIVLGVINLIHVPFGTALGVYTLWVLLPAQSEQEYRSVARAA